MIERGVSIFPRMLNAKYVWQRKYLDANANANAMLLPCNKPKCFSQFSQHTVSEEDSKSPNSNTHHRTSSLHHGTPRTAHTRHPLTRHTPGRRGQIQRAGPSTTLRSILPDHTRAPRNTHTPRARRRARRHLYTRCGRTTYPMVHRPLADASLHVHAERCGRRRAGHCSGVVVAG